MWFSWDNLALTVAQCACVALPAAGLPAWTRRYRTGAWALILPLNIALVVVAIALVPTTADVLTWVALLLVPPGCALALGWAARGARPWLAVARRAAAGAHLGGARHARRPGRADAADPRLGGHGRPAARGRGAAHAAQARRARDGGDRRLPRLLRPAPGAERRARRGRAGARAAAAAVGRVRPRRPRLRRLLRGRGRRRDPRGRAGGRSSARRSRCSSCRYAWDQLFLSTTSCRRRSRPRSCCSATRRGGAGRGRSGRAAPARAATVDLMHVEIWSDIACPWCYVGKRRFEAALAGVRAPRRRHGHVAQLRARPGRAARARASTAPRTSPRSTARAASRRSRCRSG